MMFSTERLTFRAVESPDDNDLFLSFSQDHEMVDNSTIGLPRPPSKAFTKNFVEYLTNKDKCLLPLVICLKAIGTEKPVPIGHASCRGKGAQQPHERQNRCSMIGIGILPPYQGKGFGTEAIKWILNWGFEAAGLHRIEICCFGWNEGAARLYQRLGFVLEGRLREKFWHKGAWGDDLKMAMLEHEWRAMQEAEVKKSGAA